MKLSLDNIFYELVHHHIIYTCVFLNLDDFFSVICTYFHKGHSACYAA
jgi:hypothetical protein